MHFQFLDMSPVIEMSCICLTESRLITNGACNEEAAQCDVGERAKVPGLYQFIWVCAQIACM